MENILLPSTIEFQETDDKNTGKLIVTPCHQGFGSTIGNALRRVLLSSIAGAAVEAVKIEGVQHEFSAIEGVQEDVVEIILNLKELAIKTHTDEPIRLSLSKKGEGPITAGDFEKNADLEIVNPEHIIATSTDGKKTFEMEIIIGNGLGYVSASEKESKNLDLGTILTDSFYSPVKDVGYSLENTRVGDITDYEKLTLTIATNGTISPKEAVNQATKMLMDHIGVVFSASEGTTPVLKEKKVEEPTVEEVIEESTEEEKE